MRRKKDKKLFQLTVFMEEEIVELIDYYAEKVDRPRSQMVRNLVLMGLDDAKLLNRLGVLDVIKVSQWLRRGKQQELPLGER